MKIIAHRGASGYAPENSKSAFLKAIELKSDGFEVDLQLTADDEIVIFHDWTLERTTNGSGFVQQKTLEELKTYDNGKLFPGEEFSGSILTLEELLKIIPRDKILNLEVKVLFGKIRGIEEKIIKILEENDRIKENIIISSFNHEVIKNFNKLKPELKTGLLVTAGLLNIGEYIRLNELNIYSIHSDAEFITPTFIKETKELGIKNFVWTINSLEEGQILESMGIDGIITNYPDRFIK